MHRLCIIFLILIACNGSSPKENTSAIDTQQSTSEKAPATEGIRYQGILPSTNGKGVDTTIILKENNNYTITETFLEDGRTHTEKGIFEWNENDKTIALIGENNKKTFYKVDAQVLIFLNDNNPNKKMTAEEEERYSLHQK